MALDMMLVEKGVCAVIGDQCCMFIPNNTAPNGSVTKALGDLRSLSDRMAEHSGVNDPISEWLERIFGKDLAMSLLRRTHHLLIRFFNWT